MNLFEFNGPREYLTFCCLCAGMTIESITEDGTKLIAKGKVIVIDMIDHGAISDDSWIAELTKNADWLVYKPKGENESSNFNLIDQVDKNIKRFILKQLKHFCDQVKEIEHDPANDLTIDCVKTSHGNVLGVDVIGEPHIIQVIRGML